MTHTRRRRIFLMRHGSVTYFDTDGKPRLPESVPLNEDGRAQADGAGLAFREAGVAFERVIVSGLPRTVETAARVLAQLAPGAAPAQPELWPELQEIRGVLQPGARSTTMELLFEQYRRGRGM